MNRNPSTILNGPYAVDRLELLGVTTVDNLADAAQLDITLIRREIRS